MATVLHQNPPVAMNWQKCVVNVVTGVVLTKSNRMGIFARLFKKEREGEIGIPKEVPIATLFWTDGSYDLIRYWRASLILSDVVDLEESDLADAYYAAPRNPKEIIRGVRRIKAKVTAESFSLIMKEAVPQRISHLLIKLAANGLTPSLESITQEVENGTLEWRDEFEALGVKIPPVIKARKDAEEKILAPYQGWIKAWARYKHFETDSAAISNLKSSIIESVRELPNQHRDVVVALAIARQIASDEPVFDAVTWVTGHSRGGLFSKEPRTPFSLMMEIVSQHYESNLQPMAA